MNAFLIICVTLMTLFFGTAEAMPVNQSIEITETYVVKKGDTLTAIAKKFPGTTVTEIANTNNIENLDKIYPNMLLTFSVTPTVTDAALRKTRAVSVQKGMHVHVAYRESPQVPERNVSKTTCDAASILPRLLYPNQVSQQFGEMIARHTDAKRIFPFNAVVTHEGSNYYLLIEKHCIATKIIDSLQTAEEAVVKNTDRAHENTEALTPRQRVEIIATDGIKTNQIRSSQLELNKFLARIEKELQEIMGPDENVTPLVMPLALLILRKAETGEAALLLLKK